MKKILNHKKILVTAGPTWVPLDKVRVITNIFGGNLGYLIAKKANDLGADVTLLLGPSRIDTSLNKQINFRVVKFRYYDELLALVKKEVKTKKYDVIIHSAAVSDYTPVNSYRTKIKSGQKNLTIKLKPTIKIVDLIKKIDPHVFLVKFKLEVGVNDNSLINTAYQSMLDSNADLIVANKFEKVAQTSNKHEAFIVNKNKEIIKVKGKSNIAKKLFLAIQNSI